MAYRKQRIMAAKKARKSSIVGPVEDSSIPLNTALEWAAQRLGAMRPGNEEALAWAELRESVRQQLGRMYASANAETQERALAASLKFMELMNDRERPAFAYLAKAAEAAGVIQSVRLQVAAMAEPAETGPKTLAQALGSK